MEREAGSAGRPVCDEKGVQGLRGEISDCHGDCRVHTSTWVGQEGSKVCWAYPSKTPSMRIIFEPKGCWEFCIVFSIIINTWYEIDL